MKMQNSDIIKRILCLVYGWHYKGGGQILNISACGLGGWAEDNHRDQQVWKERGCIPFEVNLSDSVFASWQTTANGSPWGSSLSLRQI